MSDRSRRTIQIVRARDGSDCQICKRPINFRLRAGSAGEMWVTLDHVIPRAHGGSSETGNLMLAHAKCNRERGARPHPSQSVRP